MAEFDSLKFEEIEKTVSYLNWYWKYFNEIFIGNEPKDRYELLRQTSPMFFSMCRTAFYEQLMLIIARLCDPATSRVRGGVGSDNLSIKNLVENLPQTSSTLQEEINNFYEVVKNNYASIKVLRDKKIAHIDSEVRLGLKKITPPLEKEVISLIVAINGLCSSIHQEYKGQSIDFTPCSTERTKSENLFNVLRAGIKYTAKEIE